MLSDKNKRGLRKLKALSEQIGVLPVSTLATSEPESTLEAWIHLYTVQSGGHKTPVVIKVDVIEKPLLHHIAGLQYTRSGYGQRIPTPFMVKYNGRWRRVYCCIFSNSGTLYIGRRIQEDNTITTVQIHR